MSQASDNELMRGVQRGQLYLMGEIYERYHGTVFGFLVKLSGNRSLSEDLMQETFIRALKYASGYRADAQFTTWLLSIARNVSNDYWKKRANQARHAPEGLETIEDMQADPAYLGEIDEEARMLQVALMQLPYEQRELILLAKVRQLSGNQLCSMFECSRSAIKVRLHRAMDNLRQFYRQSEMPKVTLAARKNYEL